MLIHIQCSKGYLFLLPVKVLSDDVTYERLGCNSDGKTERSLLS